MEMGNRVAMDFVIQLDCPCGLPQRLSYTLDIAHQRKCLVCAEIVQLDRMPLQYEATVPRIGLPELLVR
jgi:hypothetical protein